LLDVLKAYVAAQLLHVVVDLVLSVVYAHAVHDGEHGKQVVSAGFSVVMDVQLAQTCFRLASNEQEVHWLEQAKH
jgi:hypothetical protein